MIICEYLFEHFNARGDDAYIETFSERLDKLFAAGWTHVDSRKDARRGGWWRVELFKARLSQLERASAGMGR